MTERPWWASGAGGLGEDDPERAHRAGRRGEFDPLGDAARRFAEHVADWSADQAAPPADDDAGPGGDPDPDAATVFRTCGVCPVCSVIRLVGEVRPEVVDHLAAASRHLTLALKAVVDAQAARMDGGDQLERIRLDDE